MLGEVQGAEASLPGETRSCEVLPHTGVVQTASLWVKRKSWRSLGVDPGLVVCHGERGIHEIPSIRSRGELSRAVSELDSGELSEFWRAAFPVTTIRCDIDLKGGDPHCDIIKRILEDTNESVRLTLNLLHEPGHTPVRSGSRGQQAPSQTEW